MNQGPLSLAEVADRAEDLSHFGREFADWLHTVRTLRTRNQLVSALADEPAALRERFPEGGMVDAWLAAFAEHAATLAGLDAPAWSRLPRRYLSEPWFSVESPAERQLALRDSPAALRERNLFIPTVDFPLRLRAGRPPKTLEEKRRTNAERQRRFRNRRAAELKFHRHAARGAPAAKTTASPPESDLPDYLK